MSWQTGKVSDIAEIISGFAFKSEWFNTGSEKIIRIGDIQSNRIVDSGVVTFNVDKFNVSDQFQIQKGDILMALSGATVGKIAIASQKDVGSYINQRVAIVRGKNVENSSYLKYVFSGKFLQKLLLSAGGAAQPNLSPKNLADMEIPMPPISEQKRIAAILDKADSLRRKNQQAIQLADKFLRAVFLDTFGDPVTNPKGLKTGKITSLAEVITGYAFKSSEFVEASDDAVRLCRGANTLTGYFNWSDTVYWPKQKISGLDQYLIKQGDIILAMDRPWISSGLKVVIADNFDKETYLVQRVARLRPLKPIYSDFIYSCIKSKSFESHCCPTETTVPHISPVELKNFEVMVPSEVELKRFHEIVQRMRSLNRNLEFGSCKANMSFNALSQKAFTGEL